MYMYYSDIKNVDVANGPGIRVSLFVSGCRNHCPGCFQPETWNFKYGKEFDENTVQEIFRLYKNPNITGLSILGGEPFEPENYEVLEILCYYLKLRWPEKTIWVWTGYKFEDLKGNPLLTHIDVLVDGPFKQELKDLSLAFRGSSNQRIIDVQKSLRSGSTILLKGDWE